MTGNERRDELQEMRAQGEGNPRRGILYNITLTSVATSSVAVKCRCAVVKSIGFPLGQTVYYLYCL